MTEQQLPKIEDLITAEQMDALKADITKLTNESYQPILDAIIERFGFSTVTANVTSEASLALVLEDGQPVITNSVRMGVAFTPAHTYDLFEEAHRTIIREAFAQLINKK